MDSRLGTLLGVQCLGMQGRYLVKFKIDDSHWRLAPDWPTNDSPDGNTNNVLVVA